MMAMFMCADTQTLGVTIKKDFNNIIGRFDEKTLAMVQGQKVRPLLARNKEQMEPYFKMTGEFMVHTKQVLLSESAVVFVCHMKNMAVQ